MSGLQTSGVQAGAPVHGGAALGGAASGTVERGAAQECSLQDQRYEMDVYRTPFQWMIYVVRRKRTSCSRGVD